MMAPLARLGLPAHEVAMVFSLMLRFVPTIADETSTILDAQSMRGGGLDEGGPLRRIRAIVPVVVALLASCLRHADGLSRALDARCYEGGEGRTHLHEQRLGRRGRRCHRGHAGVSGRAGDTGLAAALPHFSPTPDSL